METPRDDKARAQPGAGRQGDAAAACAAEGAPRALAAAPDAPQLGVTLPTRSSEPEQDTAPGDGASAGGAGAEPALLPAHTVVGRYIVLGHLGSGGMGVVYKAYDPDLNRQIALKLVRVAASGGGDPAMARGRLLREAQGLAQLSHPNVVAVYDVGLYADGVFLAMELVAGPTLRAWLKTKPSYRDTLRVFLAAGEGLAAAHRAGLVHRDVKPDNVILGEDGRPRVLDFGLVRAVGTGAESSGDGDGSPAERVPSQASASLSSRGLLSSHVSLSSHASLAPASEVPSLGSSEGGGELGTPLTRVGAVLGTPRYMSPEQLVGRAVDAKSDQFSFCVALYEAVYGVPPFRGKTLHILRDNICDGRVSPPPAGVRVPAAVRRAILKGLAPEPDQRHPSMAELLAALARDPAAIRRRIGVALAAAVVCGLAALAVARRGPAAERCPLDRAAMAALWSPAAAAAVATAFAASGRSYAVDTAARVGAALAERASAWATMQTQSCEATWVQGTQSEALLDLRTACLAERRVEQVALVELLSRGDLDAKAVDRAVQAVGGLPPIADCADTAALRAAQAPPPPGAERQVAALRERIAAQGAATAGEALVAAARALDYAPLVGEAGFAYAEALSSAGEYAAARNALEQAMEAAGAARDDHIAALAASHLLWVVSDPLGRADEAMLSISMARTLAARVPADALVHVSLHNALGSLLGTIGDYPGAQTEFRRALELQVRSRGERQLMAARLHHNLGLLFLLEGQGEQAIPELTKALDLKRELFGAEHPELGPTLSTLADATARAGRPEQALATYRGALRILERAHGPEHVEVAQVLASMADSARAGGELDAAAAAAERSLRIYEGQPSTSQAGIGDTARVLADIRLDQARPADAVALYRRAVAAYEPAQPSLVEGLLGLGRGLTAVGHERDALAALERAAAFAAERELPTRPDAEAALARALWRTDPARARALADKALAAWAAAGRHADHDELAHWLAARR
jgi:serine/threonine protein kinase/tetratricopeptide (TPR) repeat protein